MRARDISAMGIPKILCESNGVWTSIQMTETIRSQRLTDMAQFTTIELNYFTLESPVFVLTWSLYLEGFLRE